MNKLQLIYHTDPGHGWLECNKGLLKDLGIEKEISGYSYENARKAYLEEDDDAGVLLDALKAKGIEYDIVRIYKENTPIRDYNSYRA